MVSLRKSALAAFIVLTAITAIAMGQGPLHKRVNYTINVSHSLRMGDYMLPPGKYVIYQVNQNDTNLFALYQNDMTESPVAMIRTTRVEYRLGDTPSRTGMIMDIDESSRDVHPLLKGWNIPGEDGWEIISVVSKRGGVLTRIR
ncbi:MAG TPA: hypothetical protein VF131_19005 [Blastocatellia bacterium]|nr:hypothetical protein [Blastocatellia bacterium]